jgi:signal transduction histidine kinase
MQYRTPLYFPIALLAVLFTAMTFDTYFRLTASQRANTASQIPTRARLLQRAFTPGVPADLQKWEDKQSAIADIIARINVNTRVEIYSISTGDLVPITNNASEDVKRRVPDAIIAESIQRLNATDPNAEHTFPDGLTFVSNDVHYHATLKTFALVTGEARPNGIAVLVTNLDTANATATDVFIHAKIRMAVVILICVIFTTTINVVPAIRLTNQIKSGQKIHIPWWAPIQFETLAAQLRTDRETNASSQTLLIDARDKSDRYAAQIEENQKIWRHDLLSNIKGVYDMFELLDIIGFTVDDDDHRKTYDMARNAAESAYTLVKETRQLGDLEGSLQLTPLNVSEIFDALSTKYSQNNVILNYPKGDIIVLIDTNQFTNRALVNLINNAIRYSNPPNERVEISAVQKDGKVHFLVKDNGLGISPEGIEKIMSGMGEGVRLNPEIPGSGLGLYSVRRILQAHDGALTVKSKLGEGSIFIATVKAA